MFSTFDLRLLLYVIRLAGWLKHCNLSLSLSVVRPLCKAKEAERHEIIPHPRSCFCYSALHRMYYGVIGLIKGKPTAAKDNGIKKYAKL